MSSFIKRSKRIKIEYENSDEERESLLISKSIKEDNNNDDEDDEQETNDILVPNHSIKYHKFKEDEIKDIRKDLLNWFKEHQRELPWRSKSSISNNSNSKIEKDEILNKRGYQVWISEVMSQQTKLATVLDYFKKWMDKWPTIADLSKATLEEINQVWAGLGYYRRARGIHEAAQQIMKEYKGNIPRTVDNLLKLRGIGPYTAGAIASQAFGEVTPLVDGNVIRVLSRVRSIGANPKKSATVKLYWELAGVLVDPNEPGDFNQSLMELGAIQCKVQSPLCTTCPIKNNCLAYKEEQHYNVSNQTKSPNSILNYFSKPDIKKNDVIINPNNNNSICNIKLEKEKIEKKKDLCNVCESFEDTDGPTISVTRYPKKITKLKVRNEIVNVLLVKYKEKYLLVQRPDTGLLASLWESPSLIIPNEEENEDDEDGDSDDDDEENVKKKKKQVKRKRSTKKSLVDHTKIVYSHSQIINKYLVNELNNKNLEFQFDINKLVKKMGTVEHQFSHILQFLNVYHISLDSIISHPIKCKEPNSKWISFNDIKQQAVSNQMMKCFKLLEKISTSKTRK